MFLTLLLADLAIRRDAFMVLVAVCISLVVAQVMLKASLYRTLDPAQMAWSLHPGRLIAGAALLVAGLVAGSTSRFPARPDSSAWWCAVAFALAAVGLGIVNRKEADDIVAALD